MSSAEVNLIVDEIIRQYGNNPSLYLNVDPGNGNLATYTDFRLTAGPLATSSSPNPSADPADFTSVVYENTYSIGSDATALADFYTSEFGGTYPKRQTMSGGVYSNFSYPVYLTGSGDIQAMNPEDMYDTFMAPALEKLVLGTTTSEGQAGTYFISTSTSETDATLVSATPVAIDTKADIAAFASGSLPEADDQPVTVNSFYLHRIDPVDGVDYLPPLCIKIDENNLQAFPAASFQPMVYDLIRYFAALDGNGRALRYEYYLSGSSPAGFNTRGTGITDTYDNTYNIRYDQNAPNPSATAYYAQNVPSGTPSVQSTQFLNIGFV
jgi:hypothetical protein